MAEKKIKKGIYLGIRNVDPETAKKFRFGAEHRGGMAAYLAALVRLHIQALQMAEVSQYAAVVSVLLSQTGT